VAVTDEERFAFPAFAFDTPPAAARFGRLTAPLRQRRVFANDSGQQSAVG